MLNPYVGFITPWEVALGATHVLWLLCWSNPYNTYGARFKSRYLGCVGGNRSHQLEVHRVVGESRAGGGGEVGGVVDVLRAAVKSQR